MSVPCTEMAHSTGSQCRLLRSPCVCVHTAVVLRIVFFPLAVTVVPKPKGISGKDSFSPDLGTLSFFSSLLLFLLFCPVPHEIPSHSVVPADVAVSPSSLQSSRDDHPPIRVFLRVRVVAQSTVTICSCHLCEQCTASVSSQIVSACGTLSALTSE